MNVMNFLLGILLAKDLEPEDKVTAGLLCGLTKLPAAPLLIKPVADKVTEQREEIKKQSQTIDQFKELGEMFEIDEVDSTNKRITLKPKNIDFNEGLKKIQGLIKRKTS